MQQPDTAPTRRALVANAGLFATVAAAGVPSTAVSAQLAPSPIEAAHATFVDLESVLVQKMDKLFEIEPQYVEPDRPRWHPFFVEGGYKMEVLPDNKCRCYLDDGDENIARLEEMIAQEFDPDRDDQGYRNIERAERARKTLASIVQWKDECQRRADALGLNDAKAAERKAWHALDTHIKTMLAMEPLSLRDLAKQAAVIQSFGDEDQAFELLDRLILLAQSGLCPTSKAA